MAPTDDENVLPNDPVRELSKYMSASEHKEQLNDAELQLTKTQAETEKLRAEVGKLQLETKELGRRWTKSVSILIALSTALISGLGVIFTDRQAEENRQQAQRFHDDELFAKAVEQFRDSKPDQRGPAIIALAYQARTSPRNRDEAIALIAPELQTETDPRVLELALQALPSLGTTALDSLVQKNRTLYERLAKATGRLLGVESILQRVKIPGQPTLDEVRAVYLFKQLPAEVVRTSLSWQDGVFFQAPAQLEIHPAFRMAFEQAVTSHQATPGDETEAENEFQSSIRDLSVSTHAVVGILRALSGNLAGANLRRTILLRPHFSRVDLRGIDARSAIWMAPVLADADLSFANLSDAEMKYADLRHTNLTGANIARADFGKESRNIEQRTSTELRFLQRDIILDG